MLTRRWLEILVPLATLTCFTVGGCDEELGEGACADPGASQKCTCSDGRSSVQTCDAFGTWGACYCYVPGCGNGEQDSNEECDDGNTVSGDGCSDMCLFEGAGNSGPGPGPGPGPGGGAGANGGSPSTGGNGGSPSVGGGGMGGSPSAGGGGAGGAAGGAGGT